MKKLISIAMAVVMLLCFSFTSLAVTNDGTSTTNVDVMAKYEGSIATPDVISVDISWGAMEFTYSANGSRLWNPSNHSYTTNSDAKWSGAGNKITVTNHSNVGITSDFVYNPVQNSTVTGSFDISSDTLNAGVEGDYDTADKTVATLTLGGTIEQSIADFTKVGSIEVSISKKN